MATNQALTTFVAWAPYRTVPSILERRAAVRQSHVENEHRLTDEGVIRAGVLTKDSAHAAHTDRTFFGSCMILEAESLEAARKLIEDDIYYKEVVWDKARLQILPILLAISFPPVRS